MVYADRGTYDANQGDVFENVPFNGFVMDGMLTAHDCVCDKYLTPKVALSPAEAAAFVVSVAPVHPLHQLTGNRPRDVAAGRMPRYFYLPDEEGRGELVVDLYLEQPVRFALVLAQPRVASISSEWLARLWQQFLRLRLGEDYVTFVKEMIDAH